MNAKAEKLLPKIEKAGIKASLKAGHVVSREELLEVKVQLMPTLLRWTLGGLSVASVYGSYINFCEGDKIAGYGFAVLAILFLLFAVVGVWRTLGRILDSIDAADLVGAALEGIAEAVGSLLD